MTPKEKAKELIEKIETALDVLEIDSEPGGGGWIDSDSKKDTLQKCALIAVEEIINTLFSFNYAGTMYDDFETDGITTTDDALPTKYWQQVKEEIIKTNKP